MPTPCRTIRNVPCPKPPEQVMRVPDWGCEGGRTKKSDIGARLVMRVVSGWKVGLVVQRRESLKWEPRKNCVEERETRTEGIDD